MWKYCFLFLLFSCVGQEEDFQSLYQVACGEKLKTSAPMNCAGAPFIPKLLKSQEPLVKANYDVLGNFVGNYTLQQLSLGYEDGETVWSLALKAGAEKLYQALVLVPGLGIDRKRATRIYYAHAPVMFASYKNLSSLMIDPSMELYLSGNGKNPHSLFPLSPHSKDVLLRHLHEGKSLGPIANLLYGTNALRDAELVRDLEPFFHLVLPFPPRPELTVSLGALVARKWVFEMRPEFFVETEAFFDPLALAIFEGLEVSKYLPHTRKSNAPAVAYALLQDGQWESIKAFSFEKIQLIEPHPAFKDITNSKSPSLEEHLLWKLRFEPRSYKNIRSMILAIERGHHNRKLVILFWDELQRFIKEHGLYPAFDRFIGHELQPIEKILSGYGMDLEKLIPKYRRHLKKVDLLGEGSR